MAALLARNDSCAASTGHRPSFSASIALLSVLGYFALLATPARALASSSAPGWSISSVAEPTNFDAGDVLDAEEEVTVEATGGSYELQPSQSGTATAPIAWDASAEEVQAALEALTVVGHGNVFVTGGHDNEHGRRPYLVTWVGELSGSSPGDLELEENMLTGGNATVDVGRLREAYASDRYTVTAVNMGTRAAEGETVIKDELPAGVVAVNATIEEGVLRSARECTRVVVGAVTSVTCKYAGTVAPGRELVVTIGLARVSSSLTGSLVNEARVSGGGAAEAATSESSPVNVGPAAFGIDQLRFETDGPAGEPVLQAGAHPSAVTTAIRFNNVLSNYLPGVGRDRLEPKVVQEVRVLSVDLPLGFVGDPLAAARCPEIDLTDQEGSLGEGGHPRTLCPAASIVGTLSLIWHGGEHQEPFPVYNVDPEPGYPAELGVNAVIGQPVFMYASVVRTAEGYRLRVATPAVLRAVDIEGVSVTVFGDPAEHDGTGGSRRVRDEPDGVLG